MTVTYQNEVSTVRVGGFAKMLLKWRGSVYKLFWKEFLIWTFLYGLISLCYRCSVSYVNQADRRNEDHIRYKYVFDQICIQVNKFTDMIPMSFVLGFYVSIIVGRWWQQYMNIAWPDRMLMCLSLYLRHHTINEHDTEKCARCEDARLMRRILVRWLNLAGVLTFRDVSQSVKERFPTLDHIKSAGFMTLPELEYYENTKTIHLKYWIPFIWFTNMLSKARSANLINSDFALKTIIDEMNLFRGCCGMLQSFDWISIPLVYTQVVTVAVYGFFLCCLFGRQYLINPLPLAATDNISLIAASSVPGYEFDLYVPAYTMLQFFFYMGWLKVAEQLINPFGNDDDDFDMNLVIDRNLEVSFLAIDTLFGTIPDNHGIPDIWEDREFAEAPYTAEAAKHKKAPYLGSTTLDDGDLDADAEFLPMESLYELTHEKERGMIPNFLDSMLSVRSRSSARRRLMSNHYDCNSVMDSGLDVHYHRDMPEKYNPNLRSRETSIMESSSTIHTNRARREITNPYFSNKHTPQTTRPADLQPRNGVTYESDITETSPLLGKDLIQVPTLMPQIIDESKTEVQSPLDSKRIIELVQPDGALQTVEVPAPPENTGVETEPIISLTNIAEVEKKQL